MKLDPADLATFSESERCVVLQTGFDHGTRFLATWQAWRDRRDDPRRSGRLVFIAIEPHPPTQVDLVAAHLESGWSELAAALCAAWPPLTPNLHRLSFEGGRVQLLLLITTPRRGLPELVARVDRFVLDDLARGPNPRPWDERACKALGRLAAPGATLIGPAAAPGLRQHLLTAGFLAALPAAGAPERDPPERDPPEADAVQDAAHSGLQATFAPPFTPRRAPTRDAAPRSPQRRALIVGAGLAGCAAAWALAEHGWCSRVLERGAQIAAEGSGNPVGLFHGIVNAQDGRHARFNRAAALEARSAIQTAIDHHGVAGSTLGLVRLESALGLPAMQAMLARLGLPAGYVQAIDGVAASALTGIDLAQPAWFYPGGGWVQPGGLARAFLERSAGHVSLQTGIEVQALERSATGWRLLDARGALIDTADVVVLANAGDAMRLLGDAGPPMRAVRGQISMLPVAALPPSAKLPITGAGYLLPPVNGEVFFGATAQPGDTDASVRSADHTLNLAQLQRLTGWQLDVDPQRLAGRTAWRWVTADRLPVIGAAPDPQAFADLLGPLGPHGPDGQRGTHTLRLDQARFVPRLPGLFVFTGLGSRGITWCALGAQVLASMIAGAPAPVEASLLDAIDPARFSVRRARRRGGP